MIAWRIDARTHEGYAYGVPIICDPGEPCDQPVLDARELAETLDWEFLGVMHVDDRLMEEQLREELAEQDTALAAVREDAS